jgi:hypothetical protein
MVPKLENMSFKPLLSMFTSRFLMNTFAIPFLRSVGSLFENITRIEFPLIGVKFKYSNARLAADNHIPSCKR